ncbi:MAG TPA: hypothetical protein VG963_25955 [Polyangiaceae bacterium]|nr:hypothetical protein [Polyangiaceae bacterium]
MLFSSSQTTSSQLIERAERAALAELVQEAAAEADVELVLLPAEPPSAEVADFDSVLEAPSLLVELDSFFPLLESDDLAAGVESALPELLGLLLP